MMEARWNKEEKEIIEDFLDMYCHDCPDKDECPDECRMRDICLYLQDMTDTKE